MMQYDASGSGGIPCDMGGMGHRPALLQTQSDLKHPHAVRRIYTAFAHETNPTVLVEMSELERE